MPHNMAGKTSGYPTHGVTMHDKRKPNTQEL